MALFALALALSGTIASAQTTAATPVDRPITSLPKPTAEPANNSNFANPLPIQGDGPSGADVGPVQKHFVRASKTDDLALTEVQDNASQVSHEKVAIDRKISVPLIHDVQNDPSYNPGENHALAYELKYLNWGAVTQEQLKAREGQYFTITVANDGPRIDLTARFEYRQVKSKEIVRTLIQPLKRVSGSARSYFAVVDQAYLAYGPVCSWRFSLLRGDTVVAEAKSFLW